MGGGVPGGRARGPRVPPPPGMATGAFANAPGPAGPPEEPLPKEFIEKAFFDYHLYTLSAPSTVRDRETKQLNLLRRTGVKAERRYVYDPSQDNTRHLAVELVARNEKENHLGLPLPNGHVTFENGDAGGET